MLFRLKHILYDPRRKALPGLAVGPETAKAKINMFNDFGSHLFMNKNIHDIFIYIDRYTSMIYVFLRALGVQRFSANSNYFFQ